MFQLVNKISGTGVICAIDKNYIFITTSSENNINDNCNKQTKVCGGCGGCSSAQKKRDQYDIKIYANDDVVKKLSIGNRINFITHTLEPNIASFLIFGTPIIFSIASIITLTKFPQIKTDGTLGISIIILSFFAGIIFTSIIDKIFKRVCPSQVTEIQRLTENGQGGAKDV